MPQIFRIGGYMVYFWSNESKPLEALHVHISKGKPSANATKVWITQNGKCILENNNSRIPPKTLNLLIRAIEANVEDIINKWIEQFDDITYIC